ncbi:hypothetical protein BLNAU_19123 [Blattamonas nauphoetae]|uniref:Uncharacterized protein n=1 Tax=Blattamonas nauphoetae TaxID=2049346 RepID=A0ABQ9X2I7_9EUKA|nr:hypothetical protein BLNAU_19123 [Blattamonas nauphoetae]
MVQFCVSSGLLQNPQSVDPNTRKSVENSSESGPSNNCREGDCILEESSHSSFSTRCTVSSAQIGHLSILFTTEQHNHSDRAHHYGMPTNQELPRDVMFLSLLHQPTQVSSPKQTVDSLSERS